QCRHASEGTTNRVRLQEQRFLSIRLSIPPIAEQRRVAQKLDLLAALSQKALSLREQAAAEADSLLQATIESVYHRLASEHGTVSLADCCTSITDGDHLTPAFVPTGVRFVFVGNVSTSRLHFDNCKRVTHDYFKSLRPQRVPRMGDLLYSAVG